MSPNAPPLRARAEAEAALFPPLLARAEHLARAVLLGEHGRKRPGLGNDFWQYRPMQPGDSRRSIDWRRSAKSDTQFVREKEWQVAQSVLLWIDQANSMQYSSAPDLPDKVERARVLALALSILLVRGGERVGLADGSLAPRSGDVQIQRLADVLAATIDGPDYSVPDIRGVVPHARAVFISDFMSDTASLSAALSGAADKGIHGILLQVLDPSEEAFPFRGRTIFKSVGGTLSHETLKAGDLRERYQERLTMRKAELSELCRATGWRYLCHHTNDSAQSALLWLFRAIDEGSA